MKRSLSLILTLALALGLCAAPALAAEAAPILTIYHTNDLHGRADNAFAASGEQCVGLANIAGAKAATPNALLFDAGDALQGTPVALLTQGEAMLDLMNVVGYDLMAVGNHDLDYGYDRLLELREKAAFPILCSNLSRGDKAEFAGTRVFEVGGLKVGVFALANDRLLESIMPSMVVNAKLSSCIDAAKEQAAALKAAGAELIVAVCHIGAVNEPGSVSTLQLAEAVPELDLIIDGHSHTEFPEGHRVGNTLIASTGEHGHNLGRVEVRRDAAGALTLTASLHNPEQTAALCQGEAAAKKRDSVQEGIDAVATEYEALLDQKLGHSNLTLPGKRELVRTRQTELGYLIAESYRVAMGADAAISNGGEIRADLTAGELSYRKLLTILPYLNVLQSKQVTPQILWAALENGISTLTLDESGQIDPLSAAGRFPQVAGISYTYDLARAPGERILSVSLDGHGPIARTDTQPVFVLASSIFVMGGGNDYTMLGELPLYGEYGLTSDQALRQFLNGNELTYQWVAEHSAGRAVWENRRYTVQPGDCLWNISVALYGDGYGWQRLYEANRDQIAHPDRIYAGQVLKVA